MEVVVWMLMLMSMLAMLDLDESKRCTSWVYGLRVYTDCKKTIQLSYTPNKLSLSAPSAKALSLHGLDAL